MNETRGPWYLLTGVILGLAAGVLWGWYVAPVEYTNTQPSTLRGVYKDEYRMLIALAYLYNRDTGRAQSRLALLEDSSPAESLAAQAQRANAAGRPSQEIQALSALAAVAAAPPAGIPTAVPLTVFPSLTPAASATSTPAPTASPENGSTATPEAAPPSQTPLPSITPAATSTEIPEPSATTTSFPTPTPTATQGSPFILDSRILTCTGDGPLLVIRTLNDTGSGVPGVEIILSWPNQEEHIFTGLKPELGLGYADFEMVPGITYTLRLADGSQLITDITPEQCDPGGAWGSLEITFVQP
jgi:hypothetical protein